MDAGSSGVSIHKWMGERLYGGKRCYIKIHFAVDVKTKEVLAMNVTTDDIHNSARHNGECFKA
jgi:hypothetical protein